MTKEEPDELIKALKEHFSDDGDGKVEMGAYWENKAVIEVIRNYFKAERAVDVTDVLDKIRAEIMDIHIAQVPGYKIVEEALEIIDKYKAESEE